MADAAVVTAASRLRGGPQLPGDKSISHRALLLALLADGETRISGAGDGDDVRSTAGALAALGAIVERGHAADGRVDYLVRSGGRAAIREPKSVVDCGNSGTTARLLAGVLAGSAVTASLDGDASLRRRPMGRVIAPLTAMGASLVAAGADAGLPLTIRGRSTLQPIEHATEVPSAQVKSAVLLAGLAAHGRTTVVESTPTRDHSERMLRARGVGVANEANPDGGRRVWVDGPATVRAVDERVPADPSAAGFWLVAGAVHPDAELVLSGVSTNPTRRAIIDLLRRMGADIEERPLPASGGDDGEPLADLVVRSSRLRAIELNPADVASAIDEVPVLCLAAAVAQGRTRIRGAGELRHKESDRIAGVVAGLSALGARIRADGDDIEIDGGRPLRGAAVDSLDDHRLAMTFAIGGLIADGETSIIGAGSAAISYPGFWSELEGVRA